MVDDFKNAIKSMWVARCNVFEYTEHKNKYGAIEHILLEKEINIPCRLSYFRTTQVDQDNLPFTSQVVKLLISNEININAGSIIEVTQNNITRKYKHSGVSAVYTHHQEIILDLYEEVA